MDNAFLVFFVFQSKYRGGCSELLVGISMMPLLHLSPVLAKLSSTSSSSFAWVRSKIFRVLHQKYSCSLYKCRQGYIIISRSNSKKSGRGFPFLFVLNPKNWARLHHHFSFSIQKNRQGFIKKSCIHTKSLGKVLRKNLAFTPKGQARLQTNFFKKFSKARVGFFKNLPYQNERPNGKRHFFTNFLLLQVASKAY